MGHYEPRTTAAELAAEAAAARVAAASEEENLHALRLAMDQASAGDKDALAFQVRRSQNIVDALQVTAKEKDQEAAQIRGQLTVVS